MFSYQTRGMEKYQSPVAAAYYLLHDGFTFIMNRHRRLNTNVFDDRLWEDSFSFTPERFNDRMIKPFDFLAQGGGKCP